MCWLLTAAGIMAGGLAVFALGWWHDSTLRRSDVWTEDWTDKDDWNK